MKETIKRMLLGAGIVSIIGFIIYGVYYTFFVLIPDPYNSYVVIIILSLGLFWLVGSVFRDSNPKY